MRYGSGPVAVLLHGERDALSWMDVASPGPDCLPVIMRPCVISRTPAERGSLEPAQPMAPGSQLLDRAGALASGAATHQTRAAH